MCKVSELCHLLSYFFIHLLSVVVKACLLPFHSVEHFFCHAIYSFGATAVWVAFLPPTLVLIPLWCVTFLCVWVCLLVICLINICSPRASGYFVPCLMPVHFLLLVIFALGSAPLRLHSSVCHLYLWKQCFPVKYTQVTHLLIASAGPRFPL